MLRSCWAPKISPMFSSGLVFVGNEHPWAAISVVGPVVPWICLGERNYVDGRFGGDQTVWIETNTETREKPTQSQTRYNPFGILLKGRPQQKGHSDVMFPAVRFCEHEVATRLNLGQADFRGRLTSTSKIIQVNYKTSSSQWMTPPPPPKKTQLQTVPHPSNISNPIHLTNSQTRKPSLLHHASQNATSSALFCRLRRAIHQLLRAEPRWGAPMDLAVSVEHRHRASGRGGGGTAWKAE